jgi:c-di-GMP-binding flagellar brake protein YcgR
MDLPPMNPPAKSDPSRKGSPSPFPSLFSNPKRFEKNKRRYYRVLRTTNPPLTVTLEQASGGCLFAECDDISMGGAGVRFHPDRDPKLVAGQEVLLTFQAISRPDAIRARARVVSVTPQPDKHVRYGFEFTNQAELYAQMDSYYARYFNRREHMRVLPDHSERILAHIRWARGELSSRVHDVSVGGLGLLVPVESAQLLAGVTSVHVSLHLPGGQSELRLPCLLRSCRSLVKQALLGVEYEKGPALEEAAPQLARYVEQQLARVQQYNAQAMPRKVS